MTMNTGNHAGLAPHLTMISWTSKRMCPLGSDVLAFA